jgi:hypothetical protein
MSVCSALVVFLAFDISMARFLVFATGIDVWRAYGRRTLFFTSSFSSQSMKYRSERTHNAFLIVVTLRVWSLCQSRFFSAISLVVTLRVWSLCQSRFFSAISLAVLSSQPVNWCLRMYPEGTSRQVVRMYGFRLHPHTTEHPLFLDIHSIKFTGCKV